ncbi:hypothetical protein LUZ60_016697 [Juncus effusus]|nr:hypothetical protein LUZ60_016697 [Juncus effusus]
MYEQTKMERRAMKDEEEDDIGSMSSFSDHDDSSINSRGSSSSSSELTEDASSPNSSLSANEQIQFFEGPLFEMSDLMSDLPLKRGLSQFFQGKSQSFTSLCNVRSLEDLVKPERQSNKRLKSCKSYGGGLNKPLSPKHCTKGSIMKKSSKGSFGSFGMKRRSFLGLKPPIPTTPRSSGLSGQTLLFA